MPAFQRPLWFRLRPRGQQAHYVTGAVGPSGPTAFPIIRVDSATGSDTDHSGAGPGDGVTSGSAVTSSSISTNTTGTIVTIPNADLGNVATDGSHAVFISDATGGNRNFAKIIGKGDSGLASAYVNVPTTEAFAASLASKTGGIGGLLDSIGSTTSIKLFSNNAAAGDAMPGWIVEMQSGHTETLAATYVLRRAGDTTSGTITLRGAPGAATMPVLTFSNNGVAIQLNTSYQVVANFEIQNTNATKSASEGVRLSGLHGAARNIRVKHATNNFWKGIRTAASKVHIADCEIGNCATIGIDNAASNVMVDMLNNFIYDCGTHGISIADSAAAFIYGNIIYLCTGDGINAITTTASTTIRHVIMNNTIDSNGGDGIEFSAATTQLANCVIANNILSNNGGYGIHSNATTTYYDASQILTLNNCFWNNTSGKYDTALPIRTSENEQVVDPQYKNPSGGDFTIGPNLRADGYPLGGTLKIGGNSSTYSYVDPGAAQRREHATARYMIGI